MMQKKFLNKLSKIGGVLGVSALMGASAATRVAAQASDWRTHQGGVCVGEGTDVATIQGIVCMVANVSSVVFTILAFGGLVMLVWAGLSYMLSGGNSQSVEKAKNSVKGVIIGLLLALGSFVILNLVSSFTGVDITHLYFPQ
jgi:threonine/homoserine/homoserine lactone efflux protein